jgi:hypothetical protein
MSQILSVSVDTILFILEKITAILKQDNDMILSIYLIKAPEWRHCGGWRMNDYLSTIQASLTSKLKLLKEW